MPAPPKPKLNLNPDHNSKITKSSGGLFSVMSSSMTGFFEWNKKRSEKGAENRANLGKLFTAITSPIESSKAAVSSVAEGVTKKVGGFFVKTGIILTVFGVIFLILFVKIKKAVG